MFDTFLSGDHEPGGMLPAVDRRLFLKGATLAASGALGSMVSWSNLLAADKLAAEVLVPGKDPRLIVHTSAPVVIETPTVLLAESQVTPTPLIFVRNVQPHAEAATIKPAGLADWKIELAGLLDKPRTLDAKSLADLDHVEREMVLQCSGNSRVLFNAAAPVKGTQWGRGGMANVRFAGVPLAKVLDRLGVKVDPRAKFLTAEGEDKPAPGEQDFEHSLPLEDALNLSFLALSLNGQPLPAVHGGPVRLVTPGFYGTMNVKWLRRLRFDAAESDHTSQIPHYRTPRTPIRPGAEFKPTYANSDSNWRMKIKCVVLSPAPGATLTPGESVVRGVAFNDGDARIETVLVSPDAGRTWQRAQLDVPESPYAWYRWQAALKLPPGKTQVWARAIDALGRSQPTDGSIHWNPQGYTWNGVEKIEVQVG